VETVSLKHVNIVYKDESKNICLIAHLKYSTFLDCGLCHHRRIHERYCDNLIV